MTRSLLLLCLLLVGAGSVRAQPRSDVFLQDMTWTELRAAIQSGKTTIIVPIGGTEQNGPHMALGKHNARVHALSEKIAGALGNALVAPVIAYVPEGNVDRPEGHLKFPGTITVPEAAFEQVLEYAARSFKLAGFHDIVFLGDHGGYQRAEKAVAERLDRDWAKTRIRAHAIGEYYLASQVQFPQLLKSRGYSEAVVGTHAGLADTSLLLAVEPQMVRMDRLKAAAGDSADGVHGDPSQSSAALGQLGVDLVVKRTVAAVKAAIAED